MARELNRTHLYCLSMDAEREARLVQHFGELEGKRLYRQDLDNARYHAGKRPLKKTKLQSAYERLVELTNESRGKWMFYRQQYRDHFRKDTDETQDDWVAKNVFAQLSEGEKNLLLEAGAIYT